MVKNTQKPTNYLSVFDHLWGWCLKGEISDKTDDSQPLYDIQIRTTLCQTRQVATV